MTELRSPSAACSAGLGMPQQPACAVRQVSITLMVHRDTVPNRHAPSLAMQRHCCRCAAVLMQPANIVTQLQTTFVSAAQFCRLSVCSEALWTNTYWRPLQPLRSSCSSCGAAASGSTRRVSLSEPGTASVFTADCAHNNIFRLQRSPSSSAWKMHYCLNALPWHTHIVAKHTGGVKTKSSWAKASVTPLQPLTDSSVHARRMRLRIVTHAAPFEESEHQA